MDRTDPTAGANIERVAEELRDRWQVLRVLNGTPDFMRPDAGALRGVFDGYDRWLLRACEMSGIEVPVEVGRGALLDDTRRLELRRRLVEAGWQV